MDYQTRDEVEALVQAAGGVSRLAERMGFDKNGGRQRAQNWVKNGKIPSMVCKAYAPLFKRIMSRAAKEMEK